MTTEQDLTWVLKHLRARKGAYDLYRDYYAGVHRLAFTTDKWRSEFGTMVKGVADNQCPKVVDTLVDRLEITGFTGGQEAAAAAVWKDNRLDLRSGEVHTEACKQGDAFMLVWPGPSGLATFYLNTADQMCVRYSPEVPGHIVFGGKVWIGDDDRGYATLYYPDRIEKYITKAKVSGHQIPDKGTDAVWERRVVEAGVRLNEESGEEERYDEPWPLENPFGRVPIFHFANNAALGQYGRSELSDVLPLQDILNKDLADRVITQEYHSYPQRYGIGLETEYDEEGEPKAPETGPNRLWLTANENAQYGQFDASSLEGFLKIADSDRAEIGRVSNTPIHHFYLTGEAPSGEALRTMEAPLMAKVEKRQASYGATWEDAMEFAVSLPSGDTEGIDLTTVWADASSISDKERAEEMVLKQTLGVPIQQLWKELGYTKEEIEQMLEWVAENDEARASSMNAGIDTGFETAAPAVAPTNGTGGIAPNVLANDITGQ